MMLRPKIAWLTFILGAAGLPLSGCLHHAPESTTSHSSFRFLERSAPGQKSPEPVFTLSDDAPRRFVTPAEPIQPLVAATYPARAFAARAGFATVGVRLTIDVAGHVAHVEQSFQAFTSPSAWEAEFRAAVEAAVAQWRFHPAEEESIQRVKQLDGSERYLVRHTEPVEWTLDVAFTFNESGSVLPKFAAKD
jgi:hypothetical protein